MYLRSSTILSFAVILLILPISLFSIELMISYENKEQPPFYMGNTDEVLEKPGVAVEMVKMLEDAIPGLKITLKRTPWKRCISELSDNKVDGIFNASFKESRLVVGRYPTIDNTPYGKVDSTRRITTISYSMYRLKGSGINWNGKFFTNLEDVIGAPFGYSIVEDLRKKGVAVEEAPSSRMNLDKLLSNRVQAVVLQDVTADDIIRRHSKYSNVEKVNPPVATKHYYLMLSHKFVKENPELAIKIWDKLGETRETRCRELAEKYGE